MRRRLLSLGVAVVALTAVMTACGGDDSSSAPSTTSSSTTSTSTTAVPSCSLAGASDAPTSGDPALADGAPAALLRTLQVEASDCTDAVVLSFWHGTPGYAVEYRAGPFTADPSGLPVDVAGTAFLAIRLSPASGVDLTAPDATPTYVGEPTIRPVAPSAVAQVQRLGDFEAVTSWVIGLDARRAFTVERTSSTLVVRIEAERPRQPRCTTGDVTVTVPAGWFADVGGPGPCQLFDPAPFAVQPQTDSVDWAVRVDASGVSYDDAVARWHSGTTATIVGSETTTIDGHRAVTIETESNGTGLAPAGWRTYAYVIDRAPTGSVSVVVAATQPGSTYDERVVGADQIAAALDL